jgi:hypothetical protein
MAKRKKTLEKIAESLDHLQLSRTGDIDLSLSADELFGADMKTKPSLFFLEYYSKEGIELALEKYGVYKRFEEIGFGNLQLVMDTEDPYRQRLALYSVIGKLDALLLLAEIVVRRKHIEFDPPFSSPISGRSFEILSIEWLCMQDPRKKFSNERPRLPGQEYPGLGGGKIALQLLILASRRLGLDGILNVPEYFHNAQMYSRAFKFINPEYEGKRRAIERDLLTENSLAHVSWAIDFECVRENDKPFKWFVSKQLVPLNADLKQYFKCQEYEALVKESENKFHYILDRQCWEQKKARIKG